VSQQASSEKDLMLQEMKHRIKNSIARVLAIARQTSSSSSSMEEFNKSFFARLQSMASAQELLTRSQWEKAELRTLVCSELEQVLGDSFAASRVSGPAVQLNERATQALGLTFHEMATNALKYGDPEGIQNVLEWLEPETSWRPDQKNGFGSRLMTLSIERELGGTIEKSVDKSGLIIKLTIPLRLVT
jgi:two-component sensor histidine kinase